MVILSERNNMPENTCRWFHSRSGDWGTISGIRVVSLSCSIVTCSAAINVRYDKDALYSSNDRLWPCADNKYLLVIYSEISYAWRYSNGNGAIKYELRAGINDHMKYDRSLGLCRYLQGGNTTGHRPCLGS